MASRIEQTAAYQAAQAAKSGVVPEAVDDAEAEKAPAKKKAAAKS